MVARVSWSQGSGDLCVGVWLRPGPLTPSWDVMGQEDIGSFSDEHWPQKCTRRHISVELL